jgi:hypothetical protein
MSSGQSQLRASRAAAPPGRPPARVRLSAAAVRRAPLGRVV